MEPDYKMAAQIQLKLLPGSPGYQILDGPRQLSKLDDQMVLMMKLLENFFEYGRGPGQWRWQPGSGNVKNYVGQPPPGASPKLSNNLLTGQCSATNSEGFCDALMILAKYVLGIKDAHLDKHFWCSYQRSFLTTSGTLCIDRTLVGNARTLQKNYAQLGVFHVVHHCYVRHSNRYFDPVFRRVFLDPHEVASGMWCGCVQFHTSSKFENLQVSAIPSNYIFRADAALDKNPCWVVQLGRTGSGALNYLVIDNAQVERATLKALGASL
jgi:hypothetical protein